MNGYRTIDPTSSAAPSLNVNNTQFTNTMVAINNNTQNLDIPTALFADATFSGTHGDGPQPMLDVENNSQYANLQLELNNTTFTDSPHQALQVNGAASVKIAESSFTRIRTPDCEETSNDSVAEISVAETNPAVYGNNPTGITLTSTEFSENCAPHIAVLHAEIEGTASDTAAKLVLSDNLFSANNAFAGSVLNLAAEGHGLAEFNAVLERNLFTGNQLGSENYGVVYVEEFEGEGVPLTVFRLADTQFIGNTSTNGTDLQVQNTDGRTDETVRFEIDSVTFDSSLHSNTDPSIPSSIGWKNSLDSASLLISNSTLFQNDSDIPAVNISSIYGDTGAPSTFSIQHSTIQGGGVHIENIEESELDQVVFITLDNTVIQAPVPFSSGLSGWEPAHSAVTVTATSAFLPGAQIATNADIGLAPLADNGGSFEFLDGSKLLTMLPAADSVLINSGVLPTTITIDQRGLPRVWGSLDRGAVERYLGSVDIGPNTTIAEGENATATLTWSGYPGPGLLTGHVDQTPMAFTVATANGSAFSGIDYTAVATTPSFSEPGSEEIVVSTIVRDGAQPDRSFTLEIQDITAGVEVGDRGATATVTIEADDTNTGGDPGEGPGEAPGSPGSPDLPSTGSNQPDSLQLTLSALLLVAFGASLFLMYRSTRNIARS